MDDQESSSGLMVGMIIAGAVVVVLGALVALGGALFWWEARPVAGPVFDDAAVEIAMPAPPVAPMGGRALDPNERKLIGVWDAKTPDGHVNTLDFRADRSLVWTDERQGKKAATNFRWELFDNEAAGTVLRRIPEQGAPTEWSIRFVDNDNFTLTGPVGPDAKANQNYRRRAQEAGK